MPLTPFSHSLVGVLGRPDSLEHQGQRGNAAEPFQLLPSERRSVGNVPPFRFVGTANYAPVYVHAPEVTQVILSFVAVAEVLLLGAGDRRVDGQDDGLEARLFGAVHQHLGESIAPVV